MAPNSKYTLRWIWREKEENLSPPKKAPEGTESEAKSGIPAALTFCLNASDYYEALGLKNEVLDDVKVESVDLSLSTLPQSLSVE